MNQSKKKHYWKVQLFLPILLGGSIFAFQNCSYKEQIGNGIQKKNPNPECKEVDCLEEFPLTKQPPRDQDPNNPGVNNFEIQIKNYNGNCGTSTLINNFLYMTDSICTEINAPMDAQSCIEVVFPEKEGQNSTGRCSQYPTSYSKLADNIDWTYKDSKFQHKSPIKFFNHPLFPPLNGTIKMFVRSGTYSNASAIGLSLPWKITTESRKTQVHPGETVNILVTGVDLDLNNFGNGLWYCKEEYVNNNPNPCSLEKITQIGDMDNYITVDYADIRKEFSLKFKPTEPQFSIGKYYRFRFRRGSSLSAEIKTIDIYFEKAK